MKLRVASDLHYEKHKDRGVTLTVELQDGDFDVLVLAGDVAHCKTIYEALVLICSAVNPKPVVYVFGNHEFYWGTRHLGVSEVWRAANKCKNLHVLENSILEISSQRFIGCTLWYPWYESRSYRINQEDKEMGDFVHIKGIRKWLEQTAIDSAKFLEENVRENDVVVTHYLPHPACIHPIWKDNPFNRYFLHDLSGLVERGGAKLWIHGHTHCSVDRIVGKTRVVCNPFGYADRSYPREPNPEYVSDFDIQV